LLIALVFLTPLMLLSSQRNSANHAFAHPAAPKPAPESPPAAACGSRSCSGCFFSCPASSIPSGGTVPGRRSAACAVAPSWCRSTRRAGGSSPSGSVAPKAAD